MVSFFKRSWISFLSDPGSRLFNNKRIRRFHRCFTENKRLHCPPPGGGGGEGGGGEGGGYT